MKKLKASVIISTYNQPKSLSLVLWSYYYQTEKDYEIIVADDGSSEETAQVIRQFQEQTGLSISHVWQEDKGFRKTKILNKALQKAKSDYLIFTDGDCIARNDFVAKHLSLKREKSFLSAGYFKLPDNVSNKIQKSLIETQDCFKPDWLLKQGVKKSFKINKLNSFGFKEKFLNSFTPTKATFDGMNTSGPKQAILEVNGFDERMEYGGEDREIGERLVNAGYKFIQARYSLVCLHLYHERPYKTKEALIKNKKIRKITKNKKLTYTPFGIKKQ